MNGPKRLPDLLRIACAVGALCCALPAAALPPAGAYPSRAVALDKPTGDESQALEIFQRLREQAGLPPMIWDGAMSAVAREHSQDMAAGGYCDYYSPTLGTIEYRLHRAGVSSTNARSAVFRVNSIAALEEQIRTNRFASNEGTLIGVGVASTGIASRQYYATIITRQGYTTLDPFPTLPLLGRSYRLSGTVAPGLTKLAVVVTLPDGKVIESPLEADAARRFSTTVRFDRGAGVYAVEITGSGKLGPMVLDLMRCYAGNGKDYPPPDPADKPVPTPSDMRQAERLLLDMINRARAQAALPPLKADSRLADVARGHSEDMRRNNFFAHISPTRGDLGARLARAGIKARRFTENIAVNQDLAAAHRSLMDSPGHRKNILDPEADRAGIGIVLGDARSLFVTENFLQEFAAYDTAQLEAALLKEINDLRARERLPAYKSSDALRRIAAANCAWMAQRGQAGYDKAKSELDNARLDMRSFQMAVAQTTDPPTVEMVTEQIKKDFQHVGIAVTQTTARDGEKVLYTTVLLGGQ